MLFFDICDLLSGKKPKISLLKPETENAKIHKILVILLCIFFR